MKPVTVLVALLAVPLLAAAPASGPIPGAHRHPQVLVVDVSLLRKEWDRGWMSSFYVHLGDTYGSFLTHQVNHLCTGEYTDLVPEIRGQAEQLDRDADLWRAGGWEPVGWDECDHDLIVMRRWVK